MVVIVCRCAKGKGSMGSEILDRYRYSSIPFLSLPTRSHTLSTLWSTESMSTFFREVSGGCPAGEGKEVGSVGW